MESSNPFLSNPILQLLQKCKTLYTFKQVHAQTIVTGLSLHTYPLSRLLFFSSTFSITYTLSIFNQIANPTIFLYNTVISSLTNHEHTRHIAFNLYNRILTRTSLKPNSFTYPSLFKACVFHPWIKHGLILHTHIINFLGHECDDFVRTSLLNYYANCGKLTAARYLFDRINRPDLATWNSILAAYSRGCDTPLSQQTLCLFSDMQNAGIRPNEMTLVALISACANLGSFTHGVWAHVYVVKNNLRLNRFVVTALIEMYSKCGCVDFGRQLFDRMPQKDVFCYNAIIGGLAIHGCGDMALELYEGMKLEGLVPDNVTFVVTMCACSHAGMVAEGCRIFESIKEVYGIEPAVEHYGCAVDLLSRAGRFNEAEEKIKNMPMKPNAILWRSLLGAARVHGNLEMGELALKHLVELEPETSGNYVLLSNMYASTDKWENVKSLRRLMKQQGIVKMPGNSLVEIRGVMHEFITGDKTHPLSNEIALKVEEMNRRLQEHGHKPRIKEVLFDIEEEEKEDALSFHSERLAIAFALMADDGSSGAAIRIIKNLRVCRNCHDSIKMVSSIYRREIVMRDRNRFHRFKDGSCSCLDYW